MRLLFFFASLEKTVFLWNELTNHTLFGIILRYLGMSPSRLRHRTLTPAFVSSNLAIPAKKSSFFGTRIFLSKPQAWYIIAARSAVHIIKGGKPPLYLITRKRASHHRRCISSAAGCISFRIDDMQHFVLVIYKTSF